LFLIYNLTKQESQKVLGLHVSVFHFEEIILSPNFGSICPLLIFLTRSIVVPSILSSTHSSPNEEDSKYNNKDYKGVARHHDNATTPNNHVKALMTSYSTTTTMKPSTQKMVSTQHHHDPNLTLCVKAQHSSILGTTRAQGHCHIDNNVEVNNARHLNNDTQHHGKDEGQHPNNNKGLATQPQRCRGLAPQQ
jgi:hypothetical protein